MTSAERPLLLVRTEASSAIGMGHAIRCLSLATAYAEAGGRVTFLMSSPPRTFAARAARNRIEVRSIDAVPGSPGDLEETLSHARALPAAWVALDGYEFDGKFQAGLVGGVAHVLALDDHGHAGCYHADLVLNPNAGADPAMYADRGPSTRLLLGPRFALLREEFRLWRERRPAVPKHARRVVVTFGGSDPDNVSERVLEALTTVPEPLEVMLLVGPANRHRASLELAAARCSHPVEVAVDPQDVARRLAWGDLAIAGAGGTSWELARVGTPHIAIVLARNQLPGAAALARDGLAVSLGWYTDAQPEDIAREVAALVPDSPRRAELSRRGRELVDGQGVLRVLGAMRLFDESDAAA